MKAAFLHFAIRRSRGPEDQSLGSGARTTWPTVTLEPQNGWRWREWLAEGAGTAILLSRPWCEGSGGPRRAALSALPWRSVIAALPAGVTVAVVAASAIGGDPGRTPAHRTEGRTHDGAH